MSPLKAYLLGVATPFIVLILVFIWNGVTAYLEERGYLKLRTEYGAEYDALSQEERDEFHDNIPVEAHINNLGREVYINRKIATYRKK